MSEAAATFTRHAASYDAMRRKLIPRFDDFYGTGLELLAELPGPLRILDLGAGTGLFAGIVKARFPDALVHLSDASEAMLEKGRERLAGVPGISFSVEDMAERLPEGPWDAVISALAIHHLPDADKRALFARVRAALKPGGWFINAEQVAGPDAETEARQVRLWHAQIRAAGVSEAEVAAAADRMKHDLCASVPDQLLWLAEAGLHQVDAPFRHWRFAVLVGRAPASA
ncbi:MAG: class I SAM-dependent methyltransferase [Paracoccaceae bacterium]